MFFIDSQGKIQSIPKECFVDSKQKYTFLMREKYNISIK